MKKVLIHKVFTQWRFWFILMVAFISLASSAQAFSCPVSSSSGGAGRDGDFPNPIQSGTFCGVVRGIANFVTATGIPVLVVAIVINGFMFISAQGNEQKLSNAKKTFYWIVVGTAIIMGAMVIAEIFFDFAKSLSGP